MADMSSAFSEKVSRRMWTVEPQLDGPLANFTIPAAATTFYDGQAIGRDASGTLVQMDDTLKAEFVGFETDVIASSLTVNPTDTLGDKRAHIHRPYAFVALIAAAAAGDEGKKVYWLYNNQVAYTSTNENLAGTVLGVIDTTHVLVLAPWCRAITQGGLQGTYTGATNTTVTLTKWDVNRLVIAPLQNPGATYILPQASKCSPGDEIRFIQTTSGKTLTVQTALTTEQVNGATQLTLATTQYTAARLVTDGVTSWYSV